MELLDWALANGLGAALQHLEYTRSDHQLILLDIDYQGSLIRVRNGPKSLKQRWIKEDGFKEEVQHAWEAASTDAPNGCCPN
jgi:hypothetical protein